MKTPVPSNPHLADDLALSLACGERVSHWCKARKVSPSTAYSWLKSPAFREKTRHYREQIVAKVISLAAARCGQSGAEPAPGPLTAA